MLCVFNAVVIVSISPVGNKNNELDYLERNVYKQRTRNVFIIELLVFMIFFINGLQYWSGIIVIAETIVSVLLCIGKLQDIFVGEGLYEI